MRVIPVIDLRAGRAVHARGGDRTTYPVVGGLLGSGDDPNALALAFRRVLGLDDLYLADLDAIDGQRPDLDFVRRVARTGVRVWADAGLRDAGGVSRLIEAGARTLIAATETLDGPDALGAIVGRVGPGASVFGLDLRGGRPIVAPGSTWASAEPDRLIGEALRAGLRRVLVLDTARVGLGGGVELSPAVRQLLARRPDVEVTVGGGIDGPADLAGLAGMGVAGVLIGSALHDGRLNRADLHGEGTRSTEAD